jgi:gas vesicle protein
MSNNGNSGGVFMAFVIGALAGAAVALLYAPVPGDETRRKLAERAREGRQRAETMAREGREFVNRKRDTITSVVEKGRETLTSAVEKGREAFEKTRKETL